MDLSRLEAGAFKLTPHPLVPETVLTEAMRAVAPMAAAAHVRLLREEGRNIATPAFSDSLRLRPIKDVTFAGGWRTERTLLGSYQQADAETVRQVVLHPTHRVMSR